MCIIHRLNIEYSAVKINIKYQNKNPQLCTGESKFKKCKMKTKQRESSITVKMVN